MFKEIFKFNRTPFKRKGKITHTTPLMHVPITDLKNDPEYFKQALVNYKGYARNEDNPLLKPGVFPRSK